MSESNSLGQTEKDATEQARKGLEKAEAGNTAGVEQVEQAREADPAGVEAAEQEASDGRGGPGLSR